MGRGGDGQRIAVGRGISYDAARRRQIFSLQYSLAGVET